MIISALSSILPCLLLGSFEILTTQEAQAFAKAPKREAVITAPTSLPTPPVPHDLEISAVSSPSPEELNTLFKEAKAKLQGLDTLIESEQYELARSRAKALLLAIQKISGTEQKTPEFIPFRGIIDMSDLHSVAGSYTNVRSPKSCAEIPLEKSLSMHQIAELTRRLQAHKGGLFFDLLNYAKRVSVLYAQATYLQRIKKGRLTKFHIGHIRSLLLRAYSIPLFLKEEVLPGPLIAFDSDFTESPQQYEFNHEILDWALKAPELGLESEGTFREKLSAFRCQTLINLYSEDPEKYSRKYDLTTYHKSAYTERSLPSGHTFPTQFLKLPPPSWGYPYLTAYEFPVAPQVVALSLQECGRGGKKSCAPTPWNINTTRLKTGENVFSARDAICEMFRNRGWGEKIRPNALNSTLPQCPGNACSSRNPESLYIYCIDDRAQGPAEWSYREGAPTSKVTPSQLHAQVQVLLGPSEEEMSVPYRQAKQELGAIEDLLKARRYTDARSEARNVTLEIKKRAGLQERTPRFIVRPGIVNNWYRGYVLENLPFSLKIEITEAIRAHQGEHFLDLMIVAKRASLLYARAQILQRFEELERAGKPKEIAQGDKEYILNLLVSIYDVPIYFSNRKDQESSVRIAFASQAASEIYQFEFNEEILDFLLDYPALGLDEAAFNEARRAYREKIIKLRQY